MEYNDAIDQRKNFKHRKFLVETLQKQYEGLTVHEKASANLQSLLNENTFTDNNCTSAKYFYRSVICCL